LINKRLTDCLITHLCLITPVSLFLILTIIEANFLKEELEDLELTICASQGSATNDNVEIKLNILAANQKEGRELSEEIQKPRKLVLLGDERSNAASEVVQQ
jgi:hypothetical protein